MVAISKSAAHTRAIVLVWKLKLLDSREYGDGQAYVMCANSSASLQPVILFGLAKVKAMLMAAQMSPKSQLCKS